MQQSVLIRCFLLGTLVIQKTASACRVWVLVTSALPLRVYLFDGGVVPFGAAPGSASPANPDPGGPADPDPGGAQPAANAGADLIVNLWRLDRSQARKPAQGLRMRMTFGSHDC